MSNMSYCRFQNTLSDLRDCYRAMCEDGIQEQTDHGADALSHDEMTARKDLLDLCARITNEFGEAEDDG